ncbi:hypothetical protein pipiens_003953, partial [Culex pipiens pipiens]
MTTTKPPLKQCHSEVSIAIDNDKWAAMSAETDWNDEASKYRQTRFSSRRIRKRVIFKQGDCNVVQGNVAKRRRRYLQ